MAVALADQSSHQVVKHGNAPAVKVAVHKPHGAYHATVSSQPHAAPQDVHNPYAGEKYSAAVHAPAHIPVHKPAPYHPAPVYKPAPVYHPAPVYKPAPVYHPAPVHKPAPYVAPVVHKPVVHAPAPYVAPVVHKPVVHAPAYHAPAPAYGKGPVYEDGPAVYEYGYAVNDDYAHTNFQANEHRDGYATNGEYRVALPDGLMICSAVIFGTTISFMIFRSVKILFNLISFLNKFRLLANFLLKVLCSKAARN